MYRQSEKNLLSSNISSTCSHNMVNFGPLAAEINPVVWGTPANFKGFCVLAALLHGTLVVRVSQTLRRWTEGATYIWQGNHHVGHWPTFLVLVYFKILNKNLSCYWQSNWCSCAVYDVTFKLMCHSRAFELTLANVKFLQVLYTTSVGILNSLFNISASMWNHHISI